MPGKGTYGFYEKVKPLQADNSKITETYQKTKLQNDANRRREEELELKKQLSKEAQEAKNAVEWIDFADTFDSYPGDLALTAENLNDQANNTALKLYKQAKSGAITKGEYRKGIVDIENSVRAWDSITKGGNEHFNYLSKLDPEKFTPGEVNAEMANFLGYFKDSLNISLDANNKLIYNKEDGSVISGVQQLALMKPKNLREARINQFKQIENEANVEALVTMVDGVPYVKQMDDEAFMAYIMDDARNVTQENFGDQYGTMEAWNKEDILSSGEQVADVDVAAKLATDQHLISIYKNKLAKYIVDNTPKTKTETTTDDKTAYKPIDAETNSTFDANGNADILISREDRLTSDPLENIKGIEVSDGKELTIRGNFRRIYQRDKVIQGDQSYLNYKPGEPGEKEWVLKIYGAPVTGFEDLVDKSFLDKMGKKVMDHDLILSEKEVQELDQKLHFLDKVEGVEAFDPNDPLKVK